MGEAFRITVTEARKGFKATLNRVREAFAIKHQQEQREVGRF